MTSFTVEEKPVSFEKESKNDKPCEAVTSPKINIFDALFCLFKLFKHIPINE